MARTIQIAASLPAAPDRLFDMYLDPGEHAAFTGMPVTVSAVPGSPFSAFNGVITGAILQVVPKRLIVQAWRSPYWGPTDLDSTLVLIFPPENDGARIELTQVNVVDVDFAGVSQGWEKILLGALARVLRASEIGMKRMSPPPNQPMERTLPRCALQRRSSAR